MRFFSDAAPHGFAPHDFTWHNARAGAQLHVSEFAHIARHPQLPLCVRRERYEGGQSTGEHCHLDFFALYLARGGSGVHRINATPYGISRGDAYLLPPGSVHIYESWKNLELDAFYFPLELWSEAEQAALRQSPGFWGLFLSAKHRLHLAPDAFGALEPPIAELRGDYRAAFAQNAPLAAPILLKNGLFRLLIWLARHSATAKSTAKNGDEKPLSEKTASRPRELADLLSWCESHPETPLSVEAMAARLFLSPRHFSTLFAREVGVSPAAYSRQLRLEHAKTLLLETPFSATEIALRTGWGDAAHFSRVFKAFYGASPREFRRRKGRPA